MAHKEHWPLHRRVEELLHTLVTLHRRIPALPSPEFHVWKSTSEQYDWLEHPGIPKFKHRQQMHMEDVGILRARKMVELVSNRPSDRTFDLTPAGIVFHDQHCRHDSD